MASPAIPGDLQPSPRLEARATLAQVLGAASQRCTVHFLKDCLGHAPNDQHGLLGAVIRPIFRATGVDEARARLSEALAQLEGRLAKIAALLQEAEDDLLAFYAFPPERWPSCAAPTR